MANPSSKSDPQKRLYTHLCQQRKAGCQAHLEFNYTHYRPRVLRTVIANWTPDEKAAHQRARNRERARRFRERKKGKSEDKILDDANMVLDDMRDESEGMAEENVVVRILEQFIKTGMDRKRVIEALLEQLKKEEMEKDWSDV